MKNSHQEKSSRHYDEGFEASLVASVCTKPLKYSKTDAEAPDCLECPAL